MSSWCRFDPLRNSDTEPAKKVQQDLRCCPSVLKHEAPSTDQWDVFPGISITSPWPQPSFMSESLPSGHILPHDGPFGDTLPMHFTPSLTSFNLNQISLTCLVKYPTNWAHDPSCHWRRQILPEGMAVFLLRRQPLGDAGRVEAGTPCRKAAPSTWQCSAVRKNSKGSAKGDVCDSEAADFVLFERS